MTLYLNRMAEVCLFILCLLHLHWLFRIAIGLWFGVQPYPQSNALYEVSVRQARYLPPASSRFHLAMDTLAIGYAIPAIRAHSGLSPVRITQMPTVTATVRWMMKGLWSNGIYLFDSPGNIYLEGMVPLLGFPASGDYAASSKWVQFS